MHDVINELLIYYGIYGSLMLLFDHLIIKSHESYK